MAGFDPYHKWLAIPPEEQPPHHYRLLGVVPFEPDADVIDTAAEQRMVYLRTCATGEHVAASQRLLNEVTTARLCLLNPQKKAAYDAQLRAKLSASATASSAAQAAAAAARAEPDPLDELDALEAALPSRRRTTTNRSDARRSPGKSQSSRSRILPALGGAGLLVALVVGAIIFRGRANNDEVTVEIPAPSTDDPTPGDPTSVDPSRGTTVAKTDPSAPKTTPATTSPPAGTIIRGKPGEPPVFVRPPIGTQPSGSGTHPVSTSGTLLGSGRDRIQLVPLVDPAVDAVAGTWSVGGGHARTSGSGSTRTIAFPATTNGNYDVRFRVGYRGTDFVAIHLPVGPSQVRLVIDGGLDAGWTSGLGHVDGRPFGENPTTVRGQRIRLNPPDKSTEAIRASVRIKGDEATIVAGTEADGDFVRWSGSVRSLSVPAQFALPHGNAFGLTVGPKVQDLDVHYALLMLEGGEARALPRNATTVAAAPSPPDPARTGPVLTRYVRVEIPSTIARILQLAEVQVFAQGRNVATGGVPVQSSVWGGRQASLAVDGNTDGDLDTANSTSHTLAENSPWWEVDLRQAVSIERIVVWNRTDGEAGSRLKNWRVLGLDERRQVTWIASRTEPPSPNIEFKIPTTFEELSSDERRALASYVPLASPANTVATPVVVEPVRPVVRVAVPEGETLKQAESKVKEVFGADYAAAKKPDEKRGLAKKLVDHARRSIGAEDAGPRFVLLRDARTIAAEVGDAATAMQALRELDRHFEIDFLAVAVDLLFAATKAATGASDSAAVATAALDTIDRALADDAFDTAEKLSPLVTGALRRTPDANLAQRAATMRTRLAEAKAAYVGIDAARKTLASNADDPAAHLALGRWLCFVKQDWEKGLAHLAKSGDADLAKIAALEQSAPLTFADRLALADAWWTWIEKQPAKDRKPLHLAPHHWYRLAQPAATGLDRAKIDKRLADIGKLDVVRATSGAPGSPIGSSVPGPSNPVVGTPSRDLVQPNLVDGKLAAWNASGNLEQVEGAYILLPRRFPSGPRDADRRAATAILTKQQSKFLLLTQDGTLHVRSSRGGNQEVQLPAQPFLVVSIFVRHGIAESDLNELVGLVGLTKIEIIDGLPHPNGLSRLAQSVNLRSIIFWYGDQSDQTLADLKLFPDLEEFHSKCLNVTSSGYARLAECRNLRILHMTYPYRMDDAGFEGIAALDKLTNLHFGGAKLTNAGMVHFAKLKNLEDLAFSTQLGLSSEAMSVLGELTKLRRLSLGGGGNNVTDRTIARLGGLTRLRELNISKCAVTDAALASLLQVPNLEMLNVTETAITAAAAAEFQRQRRNCKVVGPGK